MKKTLLALTAVVAAVAVRAQERSIFSPFEAMAAASISSFAAEDAFAGVGACGVLDIKTLRPFKLDEASDLVKPCVEFAAKKYAAKAVAEAGFLDAHDGAPGVAGLLIKTDLPAGSKGHRDLSLALTRREGRLLGHETKLLTKNETAPAALSALQKTVDSCLLLTVVRDIRNGEDFVAIYGRCLTRNPDLKITEIRAGAGLTVTVKTEADAARVEAYNGFVIVDAGKGPVSVMIVAYATPVYLP